MCTDFKIKEGKFDPCDALCISCMRGVVFPLLRLNRKIRGPNLENGFQRIKNNLDKGTQTFTNNDRKSVMTVSFICVNAWYVWAQTRRMVCVSGCMLHVSPRLQASHGHKMSGKFPERHWRWWRNLEQGSLEKCGWVREAASETV